MEKACNKKIIGNKERARRAEQKISYMRKENKILKNELKLYEKFIKIRGLNDEFESFYIVQITKE